MARSFRFTTDDDIFYAAPVRGFECEECSAITRTGEWVVDVDGFNVFACGYCARVLTQQAAATPIGIRG